MNLTIGLNDLGILLHHKLCAACSLSLFVDLRHQTPSAPIASRPSHLHQRRIPFFLSLRTVAAIRLGLDVSCGRSNAFAIKTSVGPKYAGHNLPTGGHKRSSVHNDIGFTLRQHSLQLVSTNGGRMIPPIARDGSP